MNTVVIFLALPLRRFANRGLRRRNAILRGERNAAQAHAAEGWKSAATLRTIAARNAQQAKSNMDRAAELAAQVARLEIAKLDLEQQLATADAFHEARHTKLVNENAALHRQIQQFPSPAPGGAGMCVYPERAR